MSGHGHPQVGRRPPDLARYRRDRRRREGGHQQQGDRLQGPQPATPPHRHLCVFTDKFFGPWVQIDSTTELVPLPQAMEGLVDYYRRISGEHPDWDNYRRAMVDQQRVLVRLTIDHVGPTHAG